VSTARQLIEEWRTRVAQETVISASAVQDRLFDLWGALRDTPSVTLVEQWLSISIERQLFSGKELVEFLDQLDASLMEGASTGPSPSEL
jgi:hypothetical protein